MSNEKQSTTTLKGGVSKDALTTVQEYAILSTRMDDLHKMKHQSMKKNGFEQNSPIPNLSFETKLLQSSKSNSDSNSGYQGYAYENSDTGEIYVIHRGSKELNLENIVKYPSEMNNDWIKSDGGVMRGLLIEQFHDAKKFLDKIKNDYPNRKIIQIGQSLGGHLTELLGALEENKDIESITFNSLGAKRQEGNLIKEGQKIQTGKGAFDNIRNYSYKDEKVSKIFGHFGKVYVSSEKTNEPPVYHNIKIHQGKPLEYEELKKRENIINKIVKRIRNALNLLGHNINKLQRTIKKLLNNIFHPTSSKDIFKGFRAAIEDENITEAQRQKLIEEKIKQIKEENKKRIKTKVNPLTKEQKKEYEKMKKILSTMKDGFLLTEYGHLITITYEQYHERYMNHLVKKLKETAKNRITKQRENKRRYVAF